MASIFDNSVVLLNWPMATVKFATDMAEMMVGAQRVVSARIPALQDALHNPRNADHVELRRMVSEKVQAFTASGRSVKDTGKTFERAAAANGRALSRMASGSILWPADWLDLFEKNLAAAASLVALPTAALKPIHAGVMGNDSRLGTRVL